MTVACSNCSQAIVIPGDGSEPSDTAPPLALAPPSKPARSATHLCLLAVAGVVLLGLGLLGGSLFLQRTRHAAGVAQAQTGRETKVLLSANRMGDGFADPVKQYDNTGFRVALSEAAAVVTPATAIETPPPLRYGLYIHFDISTFTGYKLEGIRGIGTFPPERYAPTTLDVRAWPRLAKEAGMNFAVLTAKHEAGFCLWDSPDYDYDVGSSPNKADVVAAFVAACQAEGIVPGAHYSIPDAHNEGKVLFQGNVSPLHFKLIKKQVGELVGQHPALRILLLDVSTRLTIEQLADLLDMVNQLNPQCRVWRSDYEKRAAELGQTYSSATVNKEWLWTPNGALNTSQALCDQYAKCAAQGYAFVLNVGPDRAGRIPETSRAILLEVKRMMENPQSLPASPEPAAAGRSVPEPPRDPKPGPAGALAGIGASLRKSGNDLLIQNVFPDSPAAGANLKIGEIITSINRIPAGNMEIEDAVKLLRGPVGSQVQIEVVGADRNLPRRLILTRAPIAVPTVIYRTLESGIGYLSFAGFNSTTPPQVRKHLESCSQNGRHKMVVDLRECGGGEYAAVRQVASYFIGTGPPLWLTRRVGQTRAEPVQGEFERVWDGSLVVLVSDKTAGAAELLASALASIGRAKLLGQRTSGTACLQDLRKQPDGSSQKVLLAHCFSVRDEKIYGQGIEPNTVLGLDLAAEAVMQKAVEALSSLK